MAPADPLKRQQGTDTTEGAGDRLWEAAPKNLLPPMTEDEQRSSREVTISVDDRSSDESEDREKMQDGPIDIEQYDYVTGAQMRMKNAIAEERDTGKEPIHRETTKCADDQDHRRPGQTEHNIQGNDQRNDT